MKLILSLIVVVSVTAEGNKISGGDVTSIQQYPFAASLISNLGSGNLVHRCGGSIIAKSAILSAASCFYTDGAVHPAIWWRARIGSSDSRAGGLVHIINSIIPHPSFSTVTLDNDIAVLKTTWPMEYTPTVQPARIAGGAYTTNPNDQIWAIGWGATSSTQTSPAGLREVQFWVINQQTCANRYQELGFSVTSTMVCAGWLDVGVRGQCQGDAGSPLLQDGIVVGVFSWAQGCADGWYPNINTRVSPYVWWIFNQIN